jgi:hypothetical protein
MGAFRSPNGVRKPKTKGAGAMQKPGRAMEPMGLNNVSGMPSPAGPSMGMKKGGILRKKIGGSRKHK